ncbi:hypothetical protein B0H10DRAFT_1884507 [Mycena sp. CBHHK59/15]|nr:hypothetical protein B0H10DRAFT_1884507 [Mycena sp. CBHHK59/15]
MPDLPLEIEREIFEWTARSAPDDTALRTRLMLIAHRTRTWVAPIIYELRLFLSTRDVDRFLILYKSMPPQFFANHIKTLCLGHFCIPYETEEDPFDERGYSYRDDPMEVPDTSNVCRVLAACSGTRRLACWIDFAYGDPVLGLIAPLPLRRISIELQHFTWLLKLYPHSQWLRDLTHLDLIYWSYSAAELPDLTRLPSLTHVSLGWADSSTYPAVTATVRTTCPRLKVLIVRMDSLARVVHVDKDPRVVVLLTLDPLGSWKNSGDGCPDMWTYAEEIICRRNKSSEKPLELPRMNVKPLEQGIT